MVLALLAAFLVPTLLLAWIGLGALPEETERGAARYRSRAEAVAASVASQLDGLMEQLSGAAPLAEAWEARFGVDGAWQGSTPEALRPSGVEDPQLLSSLVAELDLFEAQGEHEQAQTRLREIATLSSDPGIVAWALGARAAVCDAAGRTQDGDEARRELIERAPTARDARGLLRAFVARLALCERGSDPTSARLALYADACADYIDLEQTATAEFLRSLRAALGEQLGNSDARLEALDREDALRSQERVWRATLRRGISDWVARGAPRGRAVFAAATAPIPAANPLSMESPQEAARAGGQRFVVVLERQGESFVGRAAALAGLFERALAGRSDDGAGAAAEFTSRFESRLAPAAAQGLELVARRDLEPPLDEYAIAVRGGDFGAFLAGERRRAWLVAAAVTLAILVAALAAWLSLRAVSHEVEAARGREAFVAAVTHELKTPLAAIRLFAEMLQRGDVEAEKVREFGERTVAESDRLARLVDSVLDIARIEHSAGAQAPIEARAIAVDAIGIVERVALQQGYRIELRDESRGASVRGDADALTRAVVNLLDNALKYSDQAHTIEVEIHTREKTSVVIEVLDRGRGVPASEAQRIFEPFRRIGSELTRDRPGVGLGLALVAKIAAAHAGRVSCAPREGGGSRFTLSLPLSPQVQP